MHMRLKWTQILCTTFYFQKCKKAVICVTCGDILRENSALEINIGGMIPENCQLFVNEINRGGLVKPSDLVRTCQGYLFTSNGELLSYNAHRSVFVNRNQGVS